MPKATGWSAEQIPDLAGQTLIVTGGNSGLGLETTRELARHGARVVLACRSLEKARAAIGEVRAGSPRADVEAMALDLASLASVRAFASAFLAAHRQLHGLVNNAGVMALPRCETVDGFEMQLGTNHFGHFALTGLLLERLLETPGSRVVNLSSTMHKTGRMRWEDLNGERSYGKWTAYGQSKLANLLFSYELQRRLGAKRAQTISVACHPGYAATNLQFAGPRMQGSSWLEAGAGLMNRLFAQSAAMGALPSLYAATAPGVRGGEYFGPGGFAEMGGPPRSVRSSARSHDAADAARLWEVSADATGVKFDALKV
ncbi:MAG TPA: oxidoreductase [Myxococcota bacterium]|jgi:NAD(P)-dependent dehydrogenase (short-subunit alcohol dehydrogenase family)